MVLLESEPLSLGMVMPQFVLTDPTQQVFQLKDLVGDKGVLIVFTCNHCPYAIAVWDRLIRLSAQYQQDGVNTVAINPNINPDYPQDSPDCMLDLINERHIPFPYLIDEGQHVARAYQAQCTPDIYLLNASFELVYHGRIDDSWQDELKVRSRDLEQAMSQLVIGQPISADQMPSMGCSIKWVDA